LIDFAWLSLALRHEDAARRGFLDCLSLAEQVGDQFLVGDALTGLSAHAALTARWAEAARLAGAAEAVHERIGAPPWESVGEIQGRALTRAREALGDQLYEAHVAQGRRMSPDEALAPQHTGPAKGALTSAR
jgi:hypothetical protein